MYIHTDSNKTFNHAYVGILYIYSYIPVYNIGSILIIVIVCFFLIHRIIYIYMPRPFVCTI